MLADGTGERHGKVGQRHECLLPGPEFQQRPAERELVTGHVPAEPHDVPPVIGRRADRITERAHITILLS